MDVKEPQYLFGANDVAARRLELLACMNSSTSEIESVMGQTAFRRQPKSA
jgi:hypothetical protein